MGTAAAIAASAVVSVGGNIIGANTQSRAIKNASRTQENQQQRLLNFQQNVFDANAPLRDIALQRAQLTNKIFPSVLDQLSAPPAQTVSPAFNLAAKEGIQQLRSGFATTGSPSSGGAQTAIGRFVAGLSAAEANRLISQQNLNLGRLSNIVAPTPSPNAGVNAATSLLGAAGGTSANIANLQTQLGAVRGGLTGSIGQTFAQLPFALQQAKLNQQLLEQLKK